MSVKTTSSDNFDGEKKKIKKLGNRDIGTLLLMLYDLLVAPVSYLAALWIRFDCRYTAIPGNYFSAWLKFAPIYAAICLVVYMWRHLYQSLWKFASFVELRRILVSSVILGALHAALITLLFARMPISYYLMGITIQTAMSLFARFGYRFVSLERGKRAKTQSLLAASRVMLIGAGAAGQLILRDIHSAREINEVVACIIDDNPSKWGRSIWSDYLGIF